MSVPNFQDALPGSPAKTLRSGKTLLVPSDDPETASTVSKISNEPQNFEFNKDQRIATLEIENKELFNMVDSIKRDVKEIMNYWELMV